MLNMIATDDYISPQCRICFTDIDPKNMDEGSVVSPCACKGTMKWVHRCCLRKWRFRGKRIEEIRKCEQCLTLYNIDDIIPHRIIVKLTSTFMLAGLFVSIYYFGNIFFEAVSVVTEDLSYPNPNYMFYFIQKRTVFQYKTALQFGLGGTAVILSIMHFIFKKRNSLYVANYLFTLWRILYFNFFVDRIVLSMFTCYEIWQIFSSLTTFTDSLLVFILNYNETYKQ